MQEIYRDPKKGEGRIAQGAVLTTYAFVGLYLSWLLQSSLLHFCSPYSLHGIWLAKIILGFLPSLCLLASFPHCEYLSLALCVSFASTKLRPHL